MAALYIVFNAFDAGNNFTISSVIYGDMKPPNTAAELNALIQQIAQDKVCRDPIITFMHELPEELPQRLDEDMDMIEIPASSGAIDESVYIELRDGTIYIYEQTFGKPDRSNCVLMSVEQFINVFQKFFGNG